VLLFQDEYVVLSRKYSHAKRLIYSLKEAGNVLTEQLLTRDQEYFSHLAKLRSLSLCCFVGRLFSG
jgi:hypothetical protein